MISFSCKRIIWLIHSTSQRNSSPASFHFEYEKFVKTIKVSLYSDMMNYGMNEMIMMMFERRWQNELNSFKSIKMNQLIKKKWIKMNLIDYVDK